MLCCSVLVLYCVFVLCVFMLSCVVLCVSVSYRESVMYVAGIVLCGLLVYCVVALCTLPCMLSLHRLFVSWIGLLRYCGVVLCYVCYCFIRVIS